MAHLLGLKHFLNLEAEAPVEELFISKDNKWCQHRMKELVEKVASDGAIWRHLLLILRCFYSNLKNKANKLWKYCKIFYSSNYNRKLYMQDFFKKSIEISLTRRELIYIYIYIYMWRYRERNHAYSSSKRAQICLACKMRSGRETGDWGDRTHILSIMNRVWRQDSLHTGTLCGWPGCGILVSSFKWSSALPYNLV